MFNESDMPFLREKIQDLRSALFFNQSCSLLRMCTTIVSILKVDEVGQLWFFVSSPRQALHEFDREFPCKLEFFRKGKGFFLHITGKAYIVSDPEEINCLDDEAIRLQTGGEKVLIKVKMGRVDYFENVAPGHPSGWWKDLRTHIHAWLFNTRPGYKPYQLETPLPMLRPVA
jgi:hypothetical protein